MVSHGSSSPGWSNKSAFETDLALEESQKWIEDVTGQKFQSSKFQTSLQDGVLLCKLINRIEPGVVKKIHKMSGTMFYVENLTFFLEGCKKLGLKGSQLFDVVDLQDIPRARSAKGGSIRGDHERSLRDVCITIYWLGRAAKKVKGYEGPHLDESKFRELIAARPVKGESQQPVKGFRKPGDMEEDKGGEGEAREKVFPHVANGSGPVKDSKQSVEYLVDEVKLRDKNTGTKARPMSEFTDRNFVMGANQEQVEPRDDDSPGQTRRRRYTDGGKRGSEVFKDFAVTIDIPPGDDKFGFVVVGGKDQGSQSRIKEVRSGEIDTTKHLHESMRLKGLKTCNGSPADIAGLKAGDYVLWVNGETVLNATHSEVKSLIQKCVPTKSITVGVRRSVPRKVGGDRQQSPLVSKPEALVDPEAVTAEGAVLESMPSAADSVEMQDSSISKQDADKASMSPIPMSPPPVASPPMSPSSGDEKRSRKAKYKTSRALEVHYQTKKRTRTEVITQEEEEEVPASLQSGHSRRIIYITRAELVRHFETSTHPKREIAWLTLYAGGLFAVQPSKPVPASRIAKPLVEVETNQVVAPLPSEYSGIDDEIVVDTAPLVIHELVRSKVDINDRPKESDEVSEVNEIADVAPIAVVEAVPAAIISASVVEATPMAVEIFDKDLEIGTVQTVPEDESNGEKLRKRPRLGSADDGGGQENAKKECTDKDTDEDQVVPVAIIRGPSKMSHFGPAAPVELKPLVVVGSEVKFEGQFGNGGKEQLEENTISMMEVGPVPGIDWLQGSESFHGLETPAAVDEEESPSSTVPVEHDEMFVKVEGLVMAEGPSTIVVDDVSKPLPLQEQAEMQLQPVVESSDMDWDDLFPPPTSGTVAASSGFVVRPTTLDVPTYPNRPSRISLTEEEKAESKKKMEAIWAIAASSDDEDKDRSRRSQSPARSVPESEAEVMKKTILFRPAAHLTSWEEESEGRGGRLMTAEGMDHLLAAISNIKTKYGNEVADNDGFDFLEGMITGSEFRNALVVHHKLKAMGSDDAPLPAGTDLSPSAKQTRASLNSVETDDANELKSILRNPFFQGVCFAHDKVASQDFAPPESEPNAEIAVAPLVLSPVVDEDETLVVGNSKKEENVVDDAISPLEESVLKEPVKQVRVDRQGYDPVGVTVFVDEEEKRVFVARVLVGGIAGGQGEVKEGDEILKINGIPVAGKSVDDVAGLMKSTSGPVDFTLKATESTEGPSLSTQIFVKAQFDYSPKSDPYNPCVEVGLSFHVGDILHVLNQSDPNWWQAVKVDESNQFAGLIPGKQLQESLNAMKPKTVEVDGARKQKKKKLRWKKKRKHIYRVEDSGDYGVDEILSYEEVVKVDPDPNYKRPIVLIGPLGVGRRAAIEKLLGDHTDRFAAPIPDTSRPRNPGEQDGVDYNFIEQQAMQTGIRENQYVESGVHEGKWYGTSMKAIRDIGQSGKIAIVPLFPKSLKVLKSSDLKPYVVYMKPGNSLALSPRRAHTNGTASGHNKKDVEELDMMGEAKHIEAYFAHYFDFTLEVGDLQQVTEELIRIADRLENEPQWMCASWVG